MQRLWAIGIMCLTMGCSHSLFDSNPVRDSGSGNKTVDSGTDGASPLVCPGGCLGDALKDFSFTQGSNEGHWFYFSDTGLANGSEYVPMTMGVSGGGDAWVGDQGGTPAILKCTGDSGASLCKDIDDSIVLIAGASGVHPVLAFQVPNHGTYKVSGRVKSISGADAAANILVSRNSRHDLLSSTSIDGNNLSGELDVHVNALRGDMLLLSVIPQDGVEAAPIALQLFISLNAEDNPFPGSCQLALRFDKASDPFLEECHNTGIVEHFIRVNDIPQRSVEGTLLSPFYKKTRAFGENQYLHAEQVMDYSNDFTVQMWIKTPRLSASGNPRYAFSDDDRQEAGGLAWGFTRDLKTALFCFAFGTGNSGRECITKSNNPGRDEGWHFYRGSRRGDVISACIDGTRIGTSSTSASIDLSSVEPNIGRPFDSSYLEGEIDDVRIFSEGLPCN